MALAFTDVQGSTRLWERCPDGTRAALAVHDEVLRHALAAWGGYEVKTEGDAFMCAFADAAAAIDWAAAIQDALLAAPWPPSILEEEPAAIVIRDGRPTFAGLRVRVGVHVGTPECRPDPLTGRMDYFGPVVNRTARIAHAAHGGQVIASGAAWAEAEGRLAGRVSRDLGDHFLRGLERPERLWQVMPASIVGREFPRPRTEAGPRTNLTPPPGVLFGRERLLAQLASSLRDPTSRLVAILGPAGVGKSRLFHEVAWATLAEWPGGVIRADLASATSADAVFAAVAAALDVSLAEREPAARIGDALRGRGRSLLGLDNVDGALDLVAGLAEGWLERAPEAVIVLTTRTLPGAREQTLPVPVLGTPGPRDTEAQIRRSPAVELYLTRARECVPGLVVGPDELVDVARLVGLLDGLPLAIELAASRARVLSPAALCERLGKRFALLRDPRREDRQATLQAALDTSWDALDAGLRATFTQLSVFEGAFPLEAAEAVVLLDDDAWSVVDAVQELVDRSLLQTAHEGRAPTFVLLSTLRAYGRMHLGSPRAVEERHARWAARADAPGLAERPERIAAFERVAAWVEAGADAATGVLLGDLAAAALEAVNEQGSPAEAIALGERALTHAAAFEPRARIDVHISVGRDLRASGRLSDARAFLLAALAEAEAQGHADFAVRAARQLWQMHRQSGEIEAAAEALDRARRLSPVGAPALDLELAQIDVDRLRGALPPARAVDRYERAEASGRALGHPRSLSSAANDHGVLLFDLGRLREARRAFERSSAAARRGHAGSMEAIALANIGLIGRALGETERARASLLAALDLARAQGAFRLESSILGYLALLDLDGGHPGLARERLVEARRIAEETGLVRVAGNIAGQLGLVALDLGQPDEARARLDEAAALHRRTGNTTWEAWTQAVLAHLDLDEGDDVTARARLADAMTRGPVNPMAASALATVEARLALREHDVPRALAAASRAVAAVEELGEPSELVLALVARADAEAAAGDPDRASASRARAEALLLERGLRRASLVRAVRRAPAA